MSFFFLSRQKPDEKQHWKLLKVSQTEKNIDNTFVLYIMNDVLIDPWTKMRHCIHCLSEDL